MPDYWTGQKLHFETSYSSIVRGLYLALSFGPREHQNVGSWFEFVVTAASIITVQYCFQFFHRNLFQFEVIQYNATSEAVSFGVVTAACICTAQNCFSFFIRICFNLWSSGNGTSRQLVLKSSLQPWLVPRCIFKISCFSSITQALLAS